MPIHYFPDEIYNQDIICDEYGEDSNNWTYEEKEITCQKCLASLWIDGHPIIFAGRYTEASKEYGKYISWGCAKSGSDDWNYIKPWDFLALSENKDLYEQFLQECIITKSYLTREE